MKLSVVVVNANECRLLKQALTSVTAAAAGIEHEIIVLDNASADNSVAMLKSEFPEIKLLISRERQNYSSAANQAMQMAKGDYILLTTPAISTVHDTLSKALGFMDAHAYTGALGVRIINASGRFLPESKHGLPAAWARFFKYLFLFRFFPKLRTGAQRLYSEWTGEFENAEVDVICRNFVVYRKALLNQIGLFDERFAEYGYDIDLSYRIRLAGYKNYYFAKTHVINYSIQQTKKFTWSYLKNFYGAMLTFAGKYLLKMPTISLGASRQAPATLYELER